MKNLGKNLSKNLIAIFLILVIVSAVFNYLLTSVDEVEELSLTQLVEKINNEEIKSIVIKDGLLEIETTDGVKFKANKERQVSLGEALAGYGIDKKKLSLVDVKVSTDSTVLAWIKALLPIILPFALIIFLFWFLMKSAQRGQMQALSFGKSNLRLFSPKGKDKVTFQDVAGVDEAKEELKEIVDFLKNPKKFLDIGARIPRGVLLMGAPGSGKTLLARAVAGEANVPFFHISGSEFVELFVGVGASRVRDTFKVAKHQAPSIIFIDEIDAVGRQRGTGLGGGHDEREQTLNQILVEMDGFDRDTRVIVIAATNRPDVLDPALLRPGRFDRRIILDQPDINAREAILKIHVKDKPLDKDVNLRKIAERTPGFAGADLANLLNEAAILAARNNRKIINEHDILNSIDKVVLGPERKAHVLTDKEKEIAAYHEAGHALVSASLPNTDPVHKISIVSRGRAAGYTLKLPTEDVHFHSRSKFIDDLAGLLGGYSAEKVIFNEITTGASNDLQQATRLARVLVTQYGMSDKLGPVSYEERGEFVFLGREFGEQKSYSEEVASMIDKEVSRLINNAYKTAKKILNEKKDKLARIAKELLEKETIERQEFEKLLAESGS